MSYLFKDGNVALKLEAYRGISNYIIEYLDNLNKQDEDLYNYDYENFDEVKWDSPIFVGIRFFDIMISVFMHQGLKCQHPVYFFRILTEKILRNFKRIKEVWKEPHEWNSRYAYLLYEIVSTLENLVFWITFSEYRYPIKLNSEGHNLEGGNIIKSSIIYLVKVWDLIAQNNKVPIRFKKYLTEIILKLLFELRVSNSDESMSYSNVLFNCIKEHLFKFRGINQKFYELLKKSYSSFDKIHFTVAIGNSAEKARDLDREMEEYLERIEERL